MGIIGSLPMKYKNLAFLTKTPVIQLFVIDRVTRGVALSQKDDSVLFSINQMQNVSLNCASESTDAVDALGTPIATFYRAKSAEFSAENAIFD